MRRPRPVPRETLRAFGRWRRAGKPAVALSVHLLDPGALVEVATGRLDVTELLTCDDVRFWVEVVDDGRLLERELVFPCPEQRLEYLCRRFDIPRADWRVEVTPRPRSLSRNAARPARIRAGLARVRLRPTTGARRRCPGRTPGRPPR